MVFEKLVAAAESQCVALVVTAAAAERFDQNNNYVTLLKTKTGQVAQDRQKTIIKSNWSGGRKGYQSGSCRYSGRLLQLLPPHIRWDAQPLLFYTATCTLCTFARFLRRLFSLASRLLPWCFVRDLRWRLRSKRAPRVVRHIKSVPLFFFYLFFNFMQLRHILICSLVCNNFFFQF